MIVGKLMVFRGEDVSRDEDVLIDPTELRQDGAVELAFDAGKDRVYLKFFLHDLIRDAIASHVEEK